MNMEHICPICKTGFTGRPNRIYCSARCKRKQKKRNRAIRLYEMYFKNNPWLDALPHLTVDEFRERISRISGPKLLKNEGENDMNSYSAAPSSLGRWGVKSDHEKSSAGDQREVAPTMDQREVAKGFWNDQAKTGHLTGC